MDLGGQQQLNIDSLSAADKRELQQSLSNEMQKAKLQEGTRTPPSYHRPILTPPSSASQKANTIQPLYSSSSCIRAT